MATMSLEKKPYLSVEEAAAQLGCTPGRVRQLLRSGELQGIKLHARAWLIDAKIVAKAASIPQERGRPRIGR